MRNLKTSFWISCSIHLLVLLFIAFFATSFQQRPELETASVIELVSAPVETPPALIETPVAPTAPSAAIVPPPPPKKIEEPKPILKTEQSKFLTQEVRQAVASMPAPIVQQAKVRPSPVSDAAAPSSVSFAQSDASDALSSAEIPSSPGVIAQPRYRENPEPVYPSSAKRRREEGTVVLSVAVSATGNPAGIAVKESSGFAALDDAAQNAVRNWKFEPARSADKPVASKVEVPVRFQLSK